MPMDNLTDQDFFLLKELIYQNCGIVIKEDKKYLIVQRLGPIAEKVGCKNFSELYIKLKSIETDESFRHKVTEAITTNETSFFRDGHPFEAFKNNILPMLVENLLKQRGSLGLSSPKIRIWSAAASTGQEAYSLAILISEFLKSPFNKYNLTPAEFKILGTDISNEVLYRAKEGRYSNLEVGRGMPEDMKRRYFTPKGDQWVVSDKLKEMIEFRQANLVKNFLGLGSFELIFCRNVMIYFDDNAKRQILDQFHTLLVPQGWLFLGAMENTYCLTNKFASERFGKSIVYRKIS